ncbi:GntR family transcriptional regulator [Saccharothrix deserti]|uniref:GntR family transcriptional regulator n=1 Tax=Saccharothrix deserti TaxID=2593674 RepID=UPI00131D1AD8|nr:GntR family transcriptional regulator [Saccharothrix deserti]
MRQQIEPVEVADNHGSNGLKGGVRLADQAYLRIRDAIITVRLEPGEPLDEKALSAELGLGLTPVRDALKRLTLERLAVIYPRRGTFVTEINISDERRLTEVRLELEGLAAALAAQRATDDECAELNGLAARLEHTEDAAHLSLDYIAVDAEIHRMIYAAAHNPYLEASLNEYANLALRIWYYGLKRTPSRTPQACSQHDVVKAICARDPAAAREAARDHLRGYSVEVRTLL